MINKDPVSKVLEDELSSIDKKLKYSHGWSQLGVRMEDEVGLFKKAILYIKNRKYIEEAIDILKQDKSHEEINYGLLNLEPKCFYLRVYQDQRGHPGLIGFEIRAQEEGNFLSHYFIYGV